MTTFTTILSYFAWPLAIAGFVAWWLRAMEWIVERRQRFQAEHEAWQHSDERKGRIQQSREANVEQVNHIVDEGDLNVLAMVKGCERYIVLYHDADAGAAMRSLTAWAGNSELSFSFYDAACLSARIRQTREAEVSMTRGGL